MRYDLIITVALLAIIYLISLFFSIRFVVQGIKGVKPSVSDLKIGWFDKSQKQKDIQARLDSIS